MIDDGRRPLPSAAPGACQRHLNDEPIWSFLPPSQPLSFSFFFFYHSSSSSSSSSSFLPLNYALRHDPATDRPARHQLIVAFLFCFLLVFVGSPEIFFVPLIRLRFAISRVAPLTDAIGR